MRKHNFRMGDIAKCIAITGYEKELTRGKFYQIISEGDSIVYVRNDRSKLESYCPSRFVQPTRLGIELEMDRTILSKQGDAI